MIRRLTHLTHLFALTAGLLLAGAGTAQAQQPAGFAAAKARGELVVGVPYLAPLPVAGAKIRTPHGLDANMAEKLGLSLGLPVRLQQVPADEAGARLAAGEVDVVLADQASAPPSGVAVQPTGYRTRPKAVIRSDTTLRTPADVRGRSVCMAEAASETRALAESWGAVVRTYRVPSDALVAVREGACDVGLVDDAVWGPLVRFPEWKKFSSTLEPDGTRRERVWLLSAADSASQAWLASEMKAWNQSGAWKAMTAKWARDVAFDVYLDQEVPDCHG
ncbi:MULTISPECIES: transporter substrate-binding domain-containing protein [Achromobacter]|uniref:ABC transporter substrate-binding protein n=1 Tax=Achromobacter spanius TaxID=217203 RepID=A0AAW3I4C2_9BURK|nr:MULTISPECIES: transporter substrate-binding domain-containing protein [Achromobacter]KNE27650.1 ABC transporter substrate-binding protein [Achromobacter spanius]MCD0499085.1 transporter substrate-binding domain-containing protein [Achromobacter sp. MY14]MCW3154370.1 transporter substrate-binding domain-containing protein [Achromobacter spanius]